MKLQELFNQNNTAQVVLSFSNNNQVLITEESFNANSKFMRRSKIRLSQEFHYVSKDGDVDIYRTYRGSNKCDYIVYVNNGDYMVLESFKRNKSHNTILKETANRQMNIKDVVAPDKDPVIHVIPYSAKNEIWVIFMYNKDKLHEQHFPKKYQPQDWKDYYNHYVAIIKSTEVLYDNESLRDNIKQLIIHTGYSNVCNDITIAGKVLSGIYRAKSAWTKRLLSIFDEDRIKLQELGITISFVFDR